jgi:hypothetical protein
MSSNVVWFISEDAPEQLSNPELEELARQITAKTQNCRWQEIPDVELACNTRQNGGVFPSGTKCFTKHEIL